MIRSDLIKFESWFSNSLIIHALMTQSDCLIRSGAWILIPHEHTDPDTSDVSSKTDQDTDQET